MHCTVFLIRSICSSQKQGPHAYAWGPCFCVGTYLSSRAASSQVLSAPVSLTAVFGMGTGVPSPSSAPTSSICRTSVRKYTHCLLLQNAGLFSPHPFPDLLSASAVPEDLQNRIKLTNSCSLENNAFLRHTLRSSLRSVLLLRILFISLTA